MVKRKYSLTLNRAKRHQILHATQDQHQLSDVHKGHASFSHLPEELADVSLQHTCTVSEATSPDVNKTSHNAATLVTPVNLARPNTPGTPKPNRVFNKKKKKLFRSPVQSRVEQSDHVETQVLSGLRKLNANCPDVYTDLVAFFYLVERDQFPLDNISLSMFLDTVRWYSSTSITRARFRESCVRFITVGWMMFGGQFVRFLQGARFHGQLMEHGGDHLDPKDSSINFAIPSENTLKERVNASSHSMLRNLSPGLLPTIGSLSTSQRAVNKNYVLAIDGKKIAMGLTATSGDVDMFGFEDKPILKERKQARTVDLGIIQDAAACLKDGTASAKVQALQGVITNVTSRLKEVRELKVKRDLSLTKFRKLGGEDWRNSQYLYVISSLQTSLFQIKDFVDCTLKCLGILGKFAAAYQGVSSPADVFELKSPEALPNLYQDPNYVKQGTQEWLDLRKLAPVTGSTMYDALGQRTLKAMKIHIDKIQGKQVPTPSAEIQARMEYGRQNEINARATLVRSVLPVWYPNFHLIEEGAYFIHGDSGPLIEVSPDGSLRRLVDGQPSIPEVAVELKCPDPNVPFKTPVPYTFPRWYVLQVLSEMKALSVSKLVFLNWTPTSSTVFEVDFCPQTWEKAFTTAQELYGNKVVCPSQMPECCKLLQPEILAFVETHTRLIGKVPSSKSTPHRVQITSLESPYVWSLQSATEFEEPSAREQLSTLQQVEKVVKESYELTRTKASEMVLFMLSDTDRMHSIELPYAIPVAYGMKAANMTTEAMRRAAMHVVDSCADQGISIVCLSFDGQFLRIAVRDSEDRPLTLLQLQRDVWQETRKFSKQELLRKLRHLYEADSHMVQREESSIVVSSLDGGLPYVRARASCFLKPNAEPSPQEPVPLILQESGVPGPEESNHQLERTEGNSMQGQCEDPAQSLIDEEMTMVAEPVSWDELCDTLCITVLENMDIAEEESDTTHFEDPCGEQMLSEQPDVEDQTNADGRFLKVYKALQNADAKWQTLSFTNFEEIMSTESEIHRHLNHSNLNAALTELGCTWKKSWKKDRKVSTLHANILGSPSQIYKAQTLKELCFAFISQKSFPKEALNAGYAGWLFHHREAEWKCAAPLKDSVIVNNVQHTVDFFSQPEIHNRHMLFKCVDGHHLLVNLRASICRNALKGIRREAFERVARGGTTKLNIAMVVDGIDKQSNAFARTMFSSEVEAELKKNDDKVEAEFCQLIRNWYEAEDDPGISSFERFQKRMALRKYLMANVDMNLFPPPGMHIKGMSKVSFEAFISSIDTHTQLYALGAYNQRAIGSLTCETAFSEVSSMDPTGKGCPKARDVPQIVGKMSYLAETRLDPSRSFNMRTTKSSVYVSHPVLEAAPTMAHAGEMSAAPQYRQYIEIRDHHFDTSARRKHKAKRKKGVVSAPNEPSRGSVPVGYYHRVNEAKILPHKRLGIDLPE